MTRFGLEFVLERAVLLRVAGEEGIALVPESSGQRELAVPCLVAGFQE
jgi:hypothetical protein